MIDKSRGMARPVRADYLTDPRLLLAQQVAKGAQSTAPVGSGMEAIARVLQGGVAGYQQQSLENEYQKQSDEYRDAVAKSLASGSPVQGLQQSDNPYAQELAQELAIKDIDAKNAMNYKLQEIYDPNSPTGTRLASAADALGQYGKPSKSQKISVGADGSITIEDGVLGVGGGDNMQKPTRNKIEEKLLNATELGSRLTNISDTFKPEYLTLGTRAGMAAANMQEFAGVELEPEKQAQLKEFTTFRQNSIENLNRILNELSGAAVNESEFERLQAGQPSAGTGVFDGDGPTVFKTKLGNSIKNTRNAVIRYNWALRNGMNPLKTGVDLDKVPQLVDKEGAKIEAQLKAANPGMDDAMLEIEVNRRLGQMFGM